MRRWVDLDNLLVSIKAVFDSKTAKKVCEYLDSYIAIKEVPIWIPVAEKLPEPNRRVLMYRPCMENGETGPISVQWGWAYKDASHWMPVPDAPENEDLKDTAIMLADIKIAANRAKKRR